MLVNRLRGRFNDCVSLEGQVKIALVGDLTTVRPLEGKDRDTVLLEVIVDHELRTLDEKSDIFSIVPKMKSVWVLRDQNVHLSRFLWLCLTCKSRAQCEDQQPSRFHPRHGGRWGPTDPDDVGMLSETVCGPHPQKPRSTGVHVCKSGRAGPRERVHA